MEGDMKVLAIATLFILGTPLALFADTPKLPKDAVPLTGAQIGEWLNGRKFTSVVIYDADVPIVATTKWNLAKKRVSGSYDANGNKGKFNNEWVIEGDTSCTEKTADGKWICQKVYVVGDVMYEVNSAGKVHAISKP